MMDNALGAEAQVVEGVQVDRHGHVPRNSRVVVGILRVVGRSSY